VAAVVTGAFSLWEAGLRSDQATDLRDAAGRSQYCPGHSYTHNIGLLFEVRREGYLTALVLCHRLVEQ
jgi:hypothetical protein